MSTDHTCWQCGTADKESLFCHYCNSLQAPTPDYYQFLQLPRKLSLDANELQKQFYAMSRRLHPDLYTLRSPQEKRYSLEASSILNDAYRVLRNPIQRAEYVLREAGFEIGEQRSKDVPPELLEEVFELNMALDELRAGDEDAIPQLETSRAKFESMLVQGDGELATAFERHDQQPDEDSRRAVLAEIRATLNRRRYIQNLMNEVDKMLIARNG